MAKNRKKQEPDLSSYYGTYKVMLAYRIKNIAFYVIFLILFTVLLVFTIQQNMHDNFSNELYNLFFISFYVLLFGFILYESLNLKYKEIIINKEGVRYRSLLKNTFIEKSKINGYKFYKNDYIGHTLAVFDINHVKISIYAEDFNYENILYYLRQITHNIDEDFKQEIEKEAKREKEELINELSTFEESNNKGKTKHLISQKLDSLQDVTIIINLFFSVLSFYIIYSGRPFYIFMNLSFISIFLLIGFIFYNKGAVKFNNWLESKIPSLFGSFFMLSVSHTLRFMFDYNIIENEMMYVYAVIFPTIFYFLFNFIESLNKYVTKRIFRLNLLTHSIIFYLMSLSALNFYNCYYDNSIGIKYKVKVIDKSEHTSRRGPTTYSMTINKKIEGKYYEDVDISGYTYKRAKIGDSVNVVVNDGLLGFKWFYVEKE